jgi:hypothetical protein
VFFAKQNTIIIQSWSSFSYLPTIIGEGEEPDLRAVPADDDVTSRIQRYVDEQRRSVANSPIGKVVTVDEPTPVAVRSSVRASSPSLAVSNGSSKAYRRRILDAEHDDDDDEAEELGDQTVAETTADDLNSSQDAVEPDVVAANSDSGEENRQTRSKLLNALASSSSSDSEDSRDQVAPVGPQGKSVEAASVPGKQSRGSEIGDECDLPEPFPSDGSSTQPVELVSHDSSPVALDVGEETSSDGLNVVNECSAPSRRDLVEDKGILVAASVPEVTAVKEQVLAEQSDREIEDYRSNLLGDLDSSGEESAEPEKPIASRAKKSLSRSESLVKECRVKLSPVKIVPKNSKEEGMDLESGVEKQASSGSSSVKTEDLVQAARACVVGVKPLPKELVKVALSDGGSSVSLQEWNTKLGLDEAKVEKKEDEDETDAEINSLLRPIHLGRRTRQQAKKESKEEACDGEADEEESDAEPVKPKGRRTRRKAPSKDSASSSSATSSSSEENDDSDASSRSSRSNKKRRRVSPPPPVEQPQSDDEVSRQRRAMNSALNESSSSSSSDADRSSAPESEDSSDGEKKKSTKRAKKAKPEEGNEELDRGYEHCRSPINYYWTVSLILDHSYH